jgi:hypothetical protein
MDVEAAFSCLPETHAAVLRLRARGFDDDAIAAALALEPEAIAPLLLIAEAKLESLTAPGGAALDAASQASRNEGRKRCSS